MFEFKISFLRSLQRIADEELINQLIDAKWYITFSKTDNLLSSSSLSDVSRAKTDVHSTIIILRIQNVSFVKLSSTFCASREVSSMILRWFKTAFNTAILTFHHEFNIQSICAQAALFAAYLQSQTTCSNSILWCQSYTSSNLSRNRLYLRSSLLCNHSSSYISKTQD